MSSPLISFPVNYTYHNVSCCNLEMPRKSDYWWSWPCLGYREHLVVNMPASAGHGLYLMKLTDLSTYINALLFPWYQVAKVTVKYRLMIGLIGLSKSADWWYSSHDWFSIMSLRKWLDCWKYHGRRYSPATKQMGSLHNSIRENQYLIVYITVLYRSGLAGWRWLRDPSTDGYCKLNTV